MENEKMLAIKKLCKKYDITPSDLFCFIRAIGKISEEEAKRMVEMATCVTLAISIEAKENQ